MQKNVSCFLFSSNKHSRQKTSSSQLSISNLFSYKKTVNKSEVLNKTSKTKSLPDISTRSDSKQNTSKYSKKLTKLPDLTIHNKARQLMAELLERNKTKLFHSNYKKINKIYSINEKAYNNKVLVGYEKNSKLISDQNLSKCFGNEELKADGINNIKFIVYNRNYRDIDLSPYEPKKSENFRETFDFSLHKNFNFGTDNKKGLIKYKLLKIKKSPKKYESFDDKMNNQYNSSKSILLKINERSKKAHLQRQFLNL